MCIYDLTVDEYVVLDQDMTMNRIAASLAIAFAFAGIASPAIASSSPVETINITDVADIDTLPICVEEDCSDQPGQTGLWNSTDDYTYLERGEDYTRRIIDNTAR